MTISIAVSSPREPGWRPAQTVFRGSWSGRPAARAAETDEGGVRLGAALQVRWWCAVVDVDGRVRPGEALMVDRVEAEAAGDGITLICWSFVALAGQVVRCVDRSTA
jgi:hypothetical protein